MITFLDSLNFSGWNNRYLFIDRFCYKGKAMAISPKYIDIDYKNREDELNRYYISYDEYTGSAGTTILGLCRDASEVKVTYPAFHAAAVLHTMIDRVDSWPLFKRWLRWYRALGFDALSIALNLSSPESIDSQKLINRVCKESRSVFEKIFISIWPFEHRYKPCFREVEYVGSPEIVHSFCMYAPGNFHHIQHIAMRMCTYQVDALWYGFFDVDEFIEPSLSKPCFWQDGAFRELDCFYFQNQWHYLLDEQTSLVMPLTTTMTVGSRSKYMIKAGAAHDYGIHTPDLNTSKNALIAGKILHLINLSSYSGRSPKSLRSLASSMRFELDLKRSIFSCINL